LANAALPTNRQKEKMLGHILFECRKYNPSPAEKLFKLITIYPWRFAFVLATVQTVLCTIIWGAAYTNMILKVFGG
jgi:E3 ubiquitin-protein ligase DOA10